MPISEWFKARGERSYTAVSREARGDVPDGVWAKCDSCGHIVYQGELEAGLLVCPYCGHHSEMGARERIETLADEGSFEETDAGLLASDPLGFVAAKSYCASLESARERSGLAEAIVTGRATIGTHPVVVGAMDFRFVGASMGSVVGEKVARAFERALAERRSVVLAVASSGARMQEGMLSLMQMAKTAAAVRAFSESGLAYVAVLTDPTMGGVTASFATLADVLIAEPAALVGFTGPRVIEQTIKQHLPKGFQTSEYLVEHGMIDAVVSRAELRDAVRLVLDHLALDGVKRRGGARPGGSRAVDRAVDRSAAAADPSKPGGGA